MKEIPTFLPGRLWIDAGTARDYDAMAPFHYRTGRPATWARIYAVRFEHHDARQLHPRVVAVAVLSYPVPSCLPRRIALGITGSRSDELRFANAHVRTISRVIVHPQFRALGLSSILVEWICANCDTRYVEAMAVMGKAHPFFERAGMTRFTTTQKNGAVYYLLDREARRARNSEPPARLHHSQEVL